MRAVLGIGVTKTHLFGSQRRGTSTREPASSHPLRHKRRRAKRHVPQSDRAPPRFRLHPSSSQRPADCPTSGARTLGSLQAHGGPTCEHVARPRSVAPLCGLQRKSCSTEPMEAAPPDKRPQMALELQRPCVEEGASPPVSSRGARVGCVVTLRPWHAVS